MATRRHEKPLRRVNPSGKTVWVARYTGRDGKRRSAGTWDLKREAQAAIDAAYELEEPRAGMVTVGSYFQGEGSRKSWLDRHPRSGRTDASYSQRVRYVLDVELERRALRDWPIDEVRPAQVTDLIDHMLREQKRAADGVRGVLRVLSAMWQDAIGDGHVTVANPFYGRKVRSNDPRVQKAAREPRVWSWEQMHALCAAAALPAGGDVERLPVALRESMVRRWEAVSAWRAVYGEPMLRVFADCGPRLGEVLPLERGDVKLGGGLCGEQGCEMVGPHLHFRRTTWKGSTQSGTKTDHGQAGAGRVSPLPPALAGMLAGLPRRIDTRLLFPTFSGALFQDRNFYRDVWDPAKRASGVAATPHELRHSYVSLMRAAGVDPADLAAWTGHTVLTATTRYTHATGGSVDLGRSAVGA